MTRPESYQRTILAQSDLFEVVSIEWTESAHTDLHHHGWSQCYVLIQEGVFEDQMELGSKKEVRLLEAGQTLQTPIGAKHQIKCVSRRGKSLHVYTPKIKKEPIVLHFNAEISDYLKTEVSLNQSTRFDQLLKVTSEIRDQSISTHSPYFMNQLFSGVSPQMLLAEEVIAQSKTTLATFEASPIFSTIELEVIDRLCTQIGWPKGFRDGIGVPGGTAANFMAIHCARHQKFPEMKTEGMGAQKFKIFVSEEAHYSFKKAAISLGFGSNSVVRVPVDSFGRMNADALEAFILKALDEGATPLLVSATAGTTVLGAFDPIDSISAVCKKHRLWLHVDAAWGGPALFSSILRESIAGIALADSVTFDAHKFFGASLTCSFFLTQHDHLLLEANDVTGADYLFHSDEKTLDRGKSSWQCGRKADALSFWTIWKSLGTEGLQTMIDRSLQLRTEAIDWIKGQPRLSLVAEPEYLNICVRVIPVVGQRDSADWSRHVREELKSKNIAMVNYASNADGPFLRLIVAHPDLTLSHIQEILTKALEVV